MLSATRDAGTVFIGTIDILWTPRVCAAIDGKGLVDSDARYTMTVIPAALATVLGDVHRQGLDDM